MKRKVRTDLLILCGLIICTTNLLKAQPSDVDVPSGGLDFIHQHFSSPPNEYRMIQYLMNRNLDNHLVQELKEYGFGGIQHSVAYKDYLQDEEAWASAVKTIDLAIKNNFRVWIHDERGYPSGAAGGLVVTGHPDFEAKGLIRIAKKGEGTEKIDMVLPPGIDYLYAHICKIENGEPNYDKHWELTVEENRIQTKGLKGEWQLSVFGVKRLDRDTQAQSTMTQFGQTGRYPSLLNKNAVARFIEVTHQNYANHINSLSEKVELFYSNEPNLMTTYWKYDGSKANYAYVPWERDLPCQFKSMHGYRLLSCLDALFEGTSAKSQTVRLHFYQTVAKMFSENYVRQITAWCEKNGVQSGGHFLLEEYLACHVIYYGNMLKALSGFNMPACDIPVARDNRTNAKKGFVWSWGMPKFISSAAYPENKKMVTALLDPIIGGFGRSDLSPEIKYLKRTINMSYLCGINQVSTYIPYKNYDPDSYHKLNDYVGRLSLVLRGAKSEAGIAVYYPIETFQSMYIASSQPWHKIVKEFEPYQQVLDTLTTGMLKQGVNFNYLTAEAILEATISKNGVRVGNNEYSSIVMPCVEVISLEMLKKLKEVQAAKVPVFWVHSIPTLGITNAEHKEVQRLAKSIKLTDSPIPYLKQMTDKSYGIQIKPGRDGLLMSHFSKDGHFIHFIINDSEQENIIWAESGGASLVKIFNPEDGTIKKSGLPLSEKLKSYGSLFIIEDNDDIIPIHND